MKQIDISTKKYPNTFAMVDDCDFARLNKHKWYADIKGTKLYAVRNVPTSNGQKKIRMHRQIITIPDGLLPDHHDGNGLNNTSDNLRLCTHSQNQMNRGMSRNNTSGFKGVSWHPRENRWVAAIRVAGKLIYLGYFVSLLRAVKAYDKGAKKYHGEFARLNFPDN